jgi:murein DD-endopeptidase MepM/ murein hydrolase activator NlpD
MFYPTTVNPLPLRLDGRRGRVTSSAGAGVGGPNSSRPDHKGDDWFYPRSRFDADPVGDGGGTRNMKWNVPAGSVAIAVEAGMVEVGRYGAIGTGHRCWVKHADGSASGYFHLAELLVEPGQRVCAGTALGVIGDNPSDVDARHLHFEVELVAGDRGSLTNPSAWLAARGAVDFVERDLLEAGVVAAVLVAGLALWGGA